MFENILKPGGLLRKILIFLLAFSVLFLLMAVSGRISHDTAAGYPFIFLFLLISIGIILLGCELFANGVECIGDRLQLSHATSGSILAAVGTALPETLLPILALIFGARDHSHSIAVGAILGAPFMLSTLTFFLVGCTALVLRLMKRREQARLFVNLTSLAMELRFFIAVMVVILIVSLLRITLLNYVTAAVLMLSYGLFIRITLAHGAEAGEEYTEHFHFSHIMSCPPTRAWIGIQTATGLLLIVTGAHIFIKFLTLLSVKSGIPSLLLALLIAPVASELPEIFNSVSWTIRRKDTLAVSNVSGAMVFQATIPVSIGLAFTPWRLGATELLNIVVSLSMAAIVSLTISAKKKLPSAVLMIGGIFYLAYVLRIFLVL